ncbi:MAG TPA: DUF2071 domain-containing protein [Bryobacteraceae bacterium]|nr:DUF2071 domain-containing protein [Bryobacteraceae bacterium]
MLYLLKRHPFPIEADFGHSLVLTYAFPETLLQPLLPPGLILDTHAGCGFLAIALVETQHLRPSFLPRALGLNFFLSGYRIFARIGSAAGALRGLYILRSDTNRRLMQFGGNLLTHYKYSLCKAVLETGSQTIRWSITTHNGEADLSVAADLSTKPAPLPVTSPFADLKEARRFAGPLPYTFNYEAQTKSIIAVQGVRRNWEPQPVSVHLDREPSFFNHPPFHVSEPRLANAFHLQSVSYSWRQGRRIAVEAA